MRTGMVRFSTSVVVPGNFFALKVGAFSLGCGGRLMRSIVICIRYAIGYRPVSFLQRSTEKAPFQASPYGRGTERPLRRGLNSTTQNKNPHQSRCGFFAQLRDKSVEKMPVIHRRPLPCPFLRKTVTGLYNGTSALLRLGAHQPPALRAVTGLYSGSTSRFAPVRISRRPCGPLPGTTAEGTIRFIPVRIKKLPSQRTAAW